jgi:hypothetical protein
MKRIIWIILFVLSALLSFGQVMSMQSTNKGLSVGLETGIGGWSSQNLGVTTEKGFNYGIRLAYGFSELFELYANINSTRIKPESDAVDPFSMGHMDIGAKFNFGSTLNPLKPYAFGALTFFGSEQNYHFDDFFDFNSVFKFKGNGFTVGGGIKYHFSLPLALSFDAAITSGNYTKNEIDGEILSEEYDYTSFRINVGVVVYFKEL